MTDFGSYFEKMYRLNSDPWNYAESPYEGQKYEATCAALRSDHYRHGIEIGCSIGALSARLAVRCDRFLAIDLVGKAVEQALTRLADIPGASAMVGADPLPLAQSHVRSDCSFRSTLLSDAARDHAASPQNQRHCLTRR